MPKKSSKKKSTQADDTRVVVEEKKPTSTPKKSSSEIDGIYAGEKRKLPDREKTQKKPSGGVGKDSKPDDNGMKKNKREKKVREKGADARVVVEEKKTPSTSKKSSSEIDEIFAGKKRKLPDSDKTPKKASGGVGKASKPDEDTGIKKNKREKKDREKDNYLADPPSQSRKRTGDGLAVYTEEELGIGKADAGGTRLCPFDCDCCF